MANNQTKKATATKKSQPKKTVRPEIFEQLKSAESTAAIFAIMESLEPHEHQLVGRQLQERMMELHSIAMEQAKAEGIKEAKQRKPRDPKEPARRTLIENEANRLVALMLEIEPNDAALDSIPASITNREPKKISQANSFAIAFSYLVADDFAGAKAAMERYFLLSDSNPVVKGCPTYSGTFISGFVLGQELMGASFTDDQLDVAKKTIALYHAARIDGRPTVGDDKE